MIAVKVNKISFHPPSRSYAVILKEIDGERRLPVIVGAFEAQSIALALEYMDPPRPLTHDLIGNIIKGIGSKLKTVKITTLKEGVFYASLKLKSKNFGTKSIDARPSDAISIALRLSAQIYVTEEVIKEAGVDRNEIVSDNKQTIIPKYSLEDLEVKLKQAVDEEEYEKAAKIRDKIKELES